jgi:Fe-S cluster assembly protein SufD
MKLLLRNNKNYAHLFNKNLYDIFIGENIAHKEFIIDSKKIHFIILFFTHTIQSEIVVKLTKSGAKVQIIGIVLGKNNSNISLNTSQIHIAPTTSSNLIIKSVCDDQAMFQYKGVIRIEKNATQADAYQKNDNLLISENAVVKSSPTLEILNDKVLCKHGVTISTLDTQQLFYLTTRGIDLITASNMIIEGFLKNVVDHIEEVSVYKKIVQEFTKRIYLQ